MNLATHACKDYTLASCSTTYIPSTLCTVVLTAAFIIIEPSLTADDQLSQYHQWRSPRMTSLLCQLTTYNSLLVHHPRVFTLIFIIIATLF